MIPIYKPFLKKYKKLPIEAIDSEWISNYGIYINLASEKLCSILGVKYSILMNNGTSATQCLYKAIKFKHPEVKKIYLPNNVFVAPWNCALMEYDSKCIEIMKTDKQTLNIDVSEEYISTLDKNSCMVIVHNLGNIVNVPRLKRLRPDIVFVEDNCEGLFGKYENKFSGTESLCSAVSFYANKSITTGEGGAFITNDLELYKYIKNIYSHGMTEKRYIHDNIGYNFRMTNIQASLLYEQLNDIDTILNMKKSIFQYYDKLFEKHIESKTIVKLKNEPNTQSADWMYCIIIPNLNFSTLETYMTYNNIQIRPFFYDIHTHTHLKCLKKNDFIEDITNRGVMLPSYPELTQEQQKYITNCLIEYLETSNN